MNRETIAKFYLAKSIIEMLGWTATIVAAVVSVYCATAARRTYQTTAAAIQEQSQAVKTICGVKQIEIAE